MALWFVISLRCYLPYLLLVTLPFSFIKSKIFSQITFAFIRNRECPVVCNLFRISDYVFESERPVLSLVLKFGTKYITVTECGVMYLYFENEYGKRSGREMTY